MAEVDENYEAYMADVGRENLAKQREEEATKKELTPREQIAKICNEHSMVTPRVPELIDKILALGLVQLDEDQSLPPNIMVCNMRVIGEPIITKEVQAEIKREICVWNESQQDMLKAGWRKVKEEK